MAAEPSFEIPKTCKAAVVENEGMHASEHALSRFRVENTMRDDLP